MMFLGIETSCDETSVAVVKKDPQTNTLTVLSNITATSLALHAKTGGIIPEVAAREQLKYMIPTLTEALSQANVTKETLDAIAVTYGPGLIGSLLVGVETAKTLSLLWNKPIIPVNHMRGHIYANFLGENPQSDPAARALATEATRNPKPEFPAIALVVSGNHTDLLFMKDIDSLEVLGGTRDDAAGEAFDKIGRLLGLAYPAGAKISELAQKGDSKRFDLPRPMIGSGDYDFSFSGLKTAVLSLVKQNNWDFSNSQLSPILSGSRLETTSGAIVNSKLLFDLCACVQEAIVAVLIRKTLKAAKEYNAKSILIGGGVAANEKLASELSARSQELGVNFFSPEKKFCTDNGAMIAAAAFFHNNKLPWSDVTAQPDLYYTPYNQVYK